MNNTPFYLYYKGGYSFYYDRQCTKKYEKEIDYIIEIVKKELHIEKYVDKGQVYRIWLDEENKKAIWSQEAICKMELLF